ncbi:DNA-directed DNA polymerase [Tanacetum coccineum]|uniref:DNA-directed DNA polymerase n=1 Tax=Tanacetum coccineum TaxID=301880 RepID=A0ABQ4WK04_9ASTR
MVRVMGTKQRFQLLALLCVRMFPEESDKVESTLAERQAENKRKLDNNNQAQQQSPKRQNVAQAYAAGTGERKEYAGTLPLCNKNPAAARNQRTLTCYECGNPGHYMTYCPEPKRSRTMEETRAEGTRARGMVCCLWRRRNRNKTFNTLRMRLSF